MKKILINATQGGEIRIALVDEGKLSDLDIEINSQPSQSGNIYKAVVSRVEPSLDSAFVNYGQQRNGFLSIKEIAKESFRAPASKPFAELSISDAVKQGQELIVQVAREERGNKGAVLSTYITLVGRYLILAVNKPRTRFISKRITSSQARKKAYQSLKSLQLKENEGAIIRTYAVDRELRELEEDLAHLRELWESIKEVGADKPAPTALYQESNAIIRILRDYLNESIEEVVVDSKEVFSVAEDFLQQFKPACLDRLKLHQSDTPLFVEHQIEEQIASAFQREVALSSGGSVFFDQTEAMLAIDINSARSTRGQDSEETAWHTNMEAAREIARQLRLRDAGGLIVVDFIDMKRDGNKEEVEKQLLQAMQPDKARHHIGSISDFGLLEMSRQRIRPSIGESNYLSCPHCQGRGIIRTVESMAFSVMRAIDKKANEEKSPVLLVHLPVDLACYLFNEKYDEVLRIEKQSGKRLFILPDKSVDMPSYEIRPYGNKGMKSSYRLLPQPGLMKISHEIKASGGGNTQSALSYTHVSSRLSRSKTGIFRKLWERLTGSWSRKEAGKPSPSPALASDGKATRRHRGHGRHQQHDRRRHNHHQGQRSQQRNESRQNESRQHESRQHESRQH